MILRTMLSVVLLSTAAHAEVVRIEVKSRADVLAGKPFGAAGGFEKLSGTIYFAVDPRNDANQIITDIGKAPTNAAGKVEFSSDFYLIKPKDPGRGNGTLLYEVSNRGGKGMVGFFNLTAGSLDPQTTAEFGDGFLLEQGYMLLWVGWQFDPPRREGLVRMYPPIAREPDGRPIQGLVRSDFVPVAATTQASLADRDHIAYAVANPGDPANVLTFFRPASRPSTEQRADFMKQVRDLLRAVPGVVAVAAGSPFPLDGRSRATNGSSPRMAGPSGWPRDSSRGRSTKWSIRRRIRRSSALVPQRCVTRSPG